MRLSDEYAVPAGAPTAVYRYWQPTDADWVSVPMHGDQPTTATLEREGYSFFPVPQFFVSLIGHPGMVAIYRWWNPDDRDWVDIVDGPDTDQSLENQGYEEKTFQYYAYREQLPGTVGIYRWWNEADRDWLTVRDGEISDRDLEAMGYGSKTFLAYAYLQRTQVRRTGYFWLDAPQEAIITSAPWSGGEIPHTLSAVQVNPDSDPVVNQGYKYIGYFGHNACAGIGVARTSDLLARKWIRSDTPLFSGHEERWASALKDNGNIVMVHNEWICNGTPDGGQGYIVGRQSTDGLNGLTFSDPVPIVKELDYVNGNPTLFNDPVDGFFYLYWFRHTDPLDEIRVKRSLTFNALLDSDPSDLGQLIAHSPPVLAAPQVMYVAGVYYLAVETHEEKETVWKTRVLSASSPRGPFSEIPGNPVYGEGVACVFQYVIEDSLHTFYSREATAGANDWTLNHVKGNLSQPV
jgi:hypothetical protein